MPNIDGIEFLERLREHKPSVPVLIITGYPSIPNASAAMAWGLATMSPSRSRRKRSLGPCSGKRARKQSVAVARVRGRPSCPTRPWRPSRPPPVVLGRILGADGDRRSACVGAVVPGIRGASITAVRLPRDRRGGLPGLPPAGVAVSGKPMVLDSLRPFPGGDAGQRAVDASAPTPGQRSLRGRADRLHLHDAAR